MKELQEQHRQGLIPPPSHKLWLSNLMDVLVRESVAEPNEKERRVREVMKERHEKHEQVNKERMLTTEHKKEKSRRKMREKTPAEGGLSRDAGGGVCSASWAEQSTRAVLLDINTAQCNLSGLAVKVWRSREGGTTGGSTLKVRTEQQLSKIADETTPRQQCESTLEI